MADEKIEIMEKNILELTKNLIEVKHDLNEAKETIMYLVHKCAEQDRDIFTLKQIINNNK